MNPGGASDTRAPSRRAHVGADEPLASRPERIWKFGAPRARMNLGGGRLRPPPAVLRPTHDKQIYPAYRVSKAFTMPYRWLPFSTESGRFRPTQHHGAEAVSSPQQAAQHQGSTNAQSAARTGPQPRARPAMRPIGQPITTDDPGRSGWGEKRPGYDRGATHPTRSASRLFREPRDRIH
jgi:hypothetical protein